MGGWLPCHRKGRMVSFPPMPLESLDQPIKHPTGRCANFGGDPPATVLFRIIIKLLFVDYAGPVSLRIRISCIL